MKTVLIITFIIISCLDSSGQRKVIKTYYNNGHMESKGVLYTYSIFYDIKMPPKMKTFGEIQKNARSGNAVMYSMLGCCKASDVNCS